MNYFGNEAFYILNSGISARLQRVWNSSIVIWHGDPAEVRCSTVPAYLCSSASEHGSTEETKQKENTNGKAAVGGGVILKIQADILAKVR